MSFPTLTYLRQSEQRGVKCVDIVDADKRQKANAITSQDYCQKASIACIFWTFSDGVKISYCYCQDHLEKHIRHVFTDNIVRVQCQDGGVIKCALDQLSKIEK